MFLAAQFPTISNHTRNERPTWIPKYDERERERTEWQIGRARERGDGEERGADREGAERDG